MGFFTWTLANRTPIKRRDGEYRASCLLRYDGYGAILCPDSTLIPEPCYDGYGIFNGQDVYELVVDWNKQHLTAITNLPAYKESNLYGQVMTELMIAYQNDDTDTINRLITTMSEKYPFLKQDWKRNIGICIACGDNNQIIPYPIKIVNLKRPVPYDSLPPSITTQ